MTIREIMDHSVRTAIIQLQVFCAELDLAMLRKVMQERDHTDLLRSGVAVRDVYVEPAVFCSLRLGCDSRALDVSGSYVSISIYIVILRILSVL